MIKKHEVKACVLLVIIFSIFLPLPTWAQGMPSLETIVNKVVESTDPATGYQVDVYQTASSTSPGQQQLISTTFTIFYDPQKGFSSKEKYGSPAGSASGFSTASKARIRVDINRFLNELSAWPNVRIVADQLNGRDCFLVSGLSPVHKLSYSLWVDSQYWYVPKAVIAKSGVPFETTIEYRLVDSNYWLPSRIFMTNDYDGMYILQEFGQYEFATK